MNWQEVPVVVRRTVDELVYMAGRQLRRKGDPYPESDNIVVPLTGPDGDLEAVIAPNGAGALRTPTSS